MWWSLTRWLAKEVKKYQFYFIYCLLVHDAYSNAKKCGIKSLYLVAMTLTINLKINVILYVLQRNHVIKFGENQCKIHKCVERKWKQQFMISDFDILHTNFNPPPPKKMYDLAKLWKELTNKIALYYSNSCCENAWLRETIVAVKNILVQITKC
jgi:hypothetical protein